MPKKYNKILLNRLAYFFRHFKPEQRKFMADSVDDFLAESPKNAPRSKSLSKILDFMTQKVFRPIGKFGRAIAPAKQSPQTLKKRRDKMKPSLMLLYASSKQVQRRYRGYLAPSPASHVRRKKTSRFVGENDR